MNKAKLCCLCLSVTISLICSSCGRIEEKDVLENNTTSQIATEASAVSSNQDTESEHNDLVIDNILIISRNYCHGWNDTDTGMFITSDGRVYDFDVTGKSTDKYSRFLTYEQLYNYLLEKMNSADPITTVDVTSIIDNIQNIELSKNEWTNEYVANDIGRHDIELVRNIGNTLTFDTLYSTGDFLEGYTKNEIVMDIVNECNDIFKGVE